MNPPTDARIHEHRYYGYNDQCVVCGRPKPPVKDSEGRWRDKIEDTLDKVQENADIILFVQCAQFVVLLFAILFLHSCK